MENTAEKAYIFGSIFTLANRLQLLGDKLDAELTVKQWLFIAGVIKCGAEAPALSEVAACIGSSRQNVKKMSAILEKQAFIRMERDPGDARVLRIHLTDTCRAHLKRREALEQDFIEQIFQGFDAQAALTLAGLIQRLEDNVNEMRRAYVEEEI